MITVGYGDVYPITTNEKIFVILITVISCGGKNSFNMLIKIMKINY